MSNLEEIAKDPYRRPPSMYNYKVKKLEGNFVTFTDVVKKEYRLEFDNPHELSLEHQYGDDIDNLFIAVSYNSNYFFYRKLSNDRPWRPK